MQSVYITYERLRPENSDFVRLGDLQPNGSSAATLTFCVRENLNNRISHGKPPHRKNPPDALL